MTAATTAAARSGQAVFPTPIMRGGAYVASPIPRLVSVEVVELLLPASRQRSDVAVMRIIAVVDVAVEAARTVKPGASSDEQAASKPVGPIVTVGSAVIGGVVEVSVGAHRRDTDVDGNLSRRNGDTG
jgi:hypothetical protein